MHIDFESTVPFYQQIYEQCRKNIIEGFFPAGGKLPPIRKLASELGVARNTVEAAYRQLNQEGYVTPRSGSGFIIERLNPEEAGHSSHFKEYLSTLDFDADSLSFAHPQKREKFAFDFTYGDLPSESFPTDLWRKLTTEVLFGVEAEAVSRYNDPLGDFALRQCVANNLRERQGISCLPEQIIIQSGTQASLQALLTLFDPSKDKVAMEEPGYDGARTVFCNNRFDLVPCPVLSGSAGFLSALSKSGAQLAFVTPSNQFPTGLSMSVQTRQKLLEWAHLNDSYIIEDDYCREFHYKGAPAPSLLSLDAHHRVIYMGTFSKVLSPSLRMNYLVLPPALLRQWVDLFGSYHSSVSWLPQVVLRRLMELGYWDKILRRALTESRHKHERIISALETYLGDEADIMENGAGLHVLVGLKDGRNQKELISSAQSAGIAVYETNKYWTKRNHPMKSYVLLGHSAIQEEKIDPGIKRLAEAWLN